MCARVCVCIYIYSIINFLDSWRLVLHALPCPSCNQFISLNNTDFFSSVNCKGEMFDASYFLNSLLCMFTMMYTIHQCLLTLWSWNKRNRTIARVKKIVLNNLLQLSGAGDSRLVWSIYQSLAVTIHSYFCVVHMHVRFGLERFLTHFGNTCCLKEIGWCRFNTFIERRIWQRTDWLARMTMTYLCRWAWMFFHLSITSVCGCAQWWCYSKRWFSEDSTYLIDFKPSLVSKNTCGQF